MIDARSRRDAGLLAALFVAALLMRLAARIDHDEDIDALRFRLGVERFSVAELRPHAPYYPVYIAAAKLVVLAGASSYGALAIVGAVAGAATVILTALLAREVAGRRAALAAGVLALAAPFLWLTSTKLLSDMAGASVYLAALWLAARARRLPDRAPALRTAALLLLGVGLGVRLSYFPIALACLAVIARAEGGGRAHLARARDLLTGVVLWLVPLVVIGGARPLVRGLLVQGEGHFMRWGGSALTVTSPSLRLHGVVWGLWANVLAGPWPDASALRWIAGPILIALIALAAPRIRAAITAQPEIAIAAAAYFVWAVLGQNTAYKPRHFLPLAPLLVVVLAVGARALADRTRLASIAAVSILAAIWIREGAALVRAHRDLSPAAAIVAELRDAADRRPVLTADLGRMIAEGAPGRATREVRGGRALIEAARLHRDTGALVTSEALGAEERRALAAEGLAVRIAFTRPRSRYVDSLWSELALLEIAAR